jgi:hypothetical protein
MKKITYIILLSILFNCSSNDDDSQRYTFRNSTEFEVIVSPVDQFLDGSPDFDLIIGAGETKTYTSDYMYSLFDITSNNTSNSFNYTFQNGTRVIYDFQYKVLYRITGTATSADLTYNSPSGDTGQITSSIPRDLGFSSFQDDFLYISAQNNNETGSISVEIFYEDNLKASDGCGGSFCIAEASSSI